MLPQESVDEAVSVVRCWVVCDVGGCAELLVELIHFLRRREQPSRIQPKGHERQCRDPIALKLELLTGVPVRCLLKFTPEEVVSELVRPQSLKLQCRKYPQSRT